MASLKIALSIIAKDEEKTIGKTITSVLPEVDEVFILDTGSTDKTVEIAEALGAKVTKVGDKFVHTVTKEDIKWINDYLGPHVFIKEGDKLFRFSEARNYAISLIPKEFTWILWLDADDMLRGKDNLKKVVATAEEQQGHLVFFNYLYSCEFNPDGTIKNVLVQHLRERLFKNDGTYKWVGEIHETLVDQRGNRKIQTDQMEVVHLQQQSDLTESIDRNIKNLEFEVKATKGEDPRPFFYLAKAYYDLQEDKYYKIAERLINAYLKGSGWPEERAQAWEYIAFISQKSKNWNKAIKASMNSLIEDPESPSNWITLAQTYMFKGEWEKSLFWIKASAQVEQKATSLVLNPMDLMSKSLEILYQSNLHLNDLDKAWAVMHKLLEMHPDHKAAKDQWKWVDNLKKEKELTTKALDIIRNLYESGEKEKIQQLLHALPENVASNQLLTQVAQNILPPNKWKDNEIAIFAGPGFEIWSPVTIEKQGSGGSEEAIYRISKEFTKQGYKVTVFADPGVDKGNHDGVEYKNFYEMNWKDDLNILITWRRPDTMLVKVKSKKHYLWLHDVPMVREFTPERLENIDKVIVLSDYHRSLLKPFESEGNKYGVPDDKIWISSNGVSI